MVIPTSLVLRIADGLANMLMPSGIVTHAVFDAAPFSVVISGISAAWGGLLLRSGK